MNPLFCTLEDTLTGIQIGPHSIKAAATAIDYYEAASGARINIKKSKAMATGSWENSAYILGIPYHTEMKILGIRFTKIQPICKQQLVNSDRQNTCTGT